MKTDPTNEGNAAQTPVARPRRSLFVRLGVGLIVLLLLVALLVGLLPMLASRFAAGPIASAFAARHAGTLEVEGTSFAWNSPQGVSRVVLRDPGGGLVMQGSVAMPSLLDLLGALRGKDGAPLAVTLDVEELRLETDAEGRSNLTRALEPVDGGATSAPDREREPADGPSEAQALPGFDLVVRVQRVHFADRREGAPLAAAELADLALRVEHRPRTGLDLGALVADVTATMLAPATGRLRGEFVAPLAETGATRPAPRFELELVEFDVAALDAAMAPELAGKLTALFGAALEIDVGLTWLAAAGWDQNLGGLGQLPPLEQNLSLDLSLVSPRLTGAGQLELNGGRLALGAPLALSGALDAVTLAAFLPKGGAIEGAAADEAADPVADPLAGLGASPDGRFELHVTELDVDLVGLPDAATRTQTAATASLAATAGATGLTFAPPGQPPTAVEEMQVVLTAAPGEATRLVGTARLAPGTATGAATGSARLELQGPTADALAQGLLADPPTLGALELGGQMHGLSTPWLDNLLSADGLLVDLLGSPIDATLHGRELKVLGDERSGNVELLLVSELARVETALTLEGDTLVPRGDAPLDVRFALTPLSSPRVVGSLVPMVATVVGTEPNQRASLVLRNFRLPLDGDIAKLSGEVVLDAGEVVPSLFPAAAQLLGSLLPTPSATRLGPYTFQLADGRASYENLEVRIDGRPFAFSGSVDLVGGGIDLGTALPLASLGGEVGSWVKSAGSLLDPKMTVPVRLVGSWTKPRLQLGAETERVLQDAARKAAEGALQKELEKGLEKGLGDLFKKLKRD